MLGPVEPRPIAVPVAQPIATPVAQPIPAPVAEPVPVPVAPPVRPPTLRPTLAPTFLPTNSPTLNPTPRPSRAPSGIPSLIPTALPSNTPSSRPSDYPSYFPSRSPTTLASTIKPSLQPSSEPSTITMSPTLSTVPSVNPSGAPSEETPSSQPTLQPSLPISTESVDVVMLLDSMNGVLRGRAAIDFESATSAHIKQTTESSGVQIVGFRVDTNINTQEVVPATTTLTSGGRRKLQSLSPLQIALSVLIDYQNSTDSESYDPAMWVQEAFNSKEERDSYIARLKEKNDEFANLISVSLLVDGEVPVEETVELNNSSKLGIIIGAAVGGAVGLALAAFIFSRWGQKYQGAGGKQVNAETALSTYDTPNRIQTEILVDRQDDVSTLGDPVFTGGFNMNMGDRDERTASVADDYDYAKEYLLGQQTRERVTSVDSGPSGKTSGTFSRVGSGPMTSSVFADDASFEQQYEDDELPEDKKFEVHVPPGKLGMVIDTPNGGVPIVHAIKPESILADKVLVGDRLVSVDDEDVTSMTAVQVSKLISVKSDKNRILKFVRNQNVIDSLGK